MSLFTTQDFISVGAAGSDWREAAKAVLKKLEEADLSSSSYTLGFLYITDSLADDATSIFNLLRSVLDVQHWTGTIGIGIYTNDAVYIDQPAISLMLGQIDSKELCAFQFSAGQKDPALEDWTSTADPMLVFVHGNPLSEKDPAQCFKELAANTKGFLLGGLSSSRTAHVQFSDKPLEEFDLSGLAFSQNIPVASVLSQGCIPVAGMHTITRGDGNLIREIDHKKAADVFENDLRDMAIKKIGRDPDKVLIDEADIADIEEIIPETEELQPVFSGEIHAAFPLSSSDQKDYLVRNIIGIDPDEGTMAVSEHVSTGQRILFVHLDTSTVEEDLKTQLRAFHERVVKDYGSFSPKAALYVSCVARGISRDVSASEINILHDFLGDVPLTGFYAGGEVSNAEFYGYSGILTLFL